MIPDPWDSREGGQFIPRGGGQRRAVCLGPTLSTSPTAGEALELMASNRSTSCKGFLQGSKRGPFSYKCSSFLGCGPEPRALALTCCVMPDKPPDPELGIPLLVMSPPPTSQGC